MIWLPAGAMDAAVAAANEQHRQELHSIKAAALANLAWLHLQQQLWQQAQQTCEAWLQVLSLPSPFGIGQSYWMIAVLSLSARQY